MYAVLQSYTLLALPVLLQNFVIDVVNQFPLHLRRSIVLDGVLDRIAEPLSWLRRVD